MKEFEYSIPVAEDCRYFKGDLPCKFHKSEGAKCVCAHYEKRGKRILIIKLGAIGDVVRTTPLLRKLKADDPACEITWITKSPAVLPRLIDRPMAFTAENTVAIQADHFDIAYNLDKDREACALMSLARADERRGFELKNGRARPIDQKAVHKYLTGLDDELNRSNRLSYPKEIFDIVGLPYNGERYVMDKPEPFGTGLKERRPLVGLNTGCGSRWPTRLWPIDSWVTLAKQLRAKGIGVILLGGPEEHERNLEIAKHSGAPYLGHFPLGRFISLLNECDLVVTGVTMAQHLAIGLGKKIVLFNNIFNRHEFEMYGLGEILEPPDGCRCYFKSECDNPCLPTITVERVQQSVTELLKNGTPIL